ncbi:MAG TPA: pyroglutamyl-peptidase I [Xanthobacteraceae bacterium]|nr:pyroglutamyl-peptidase I [Xanthobacteraceae bacterium]
MNAKILVTGFGPFPRAPVNPTVALVARLARTARRHGIDCVTHVFDTSYAAVDRELPALIAAHRPDAIVMFGLAAGRKSVSVEAFARNRANSWFPDAARATPQRGVIAPGGPARRRGRAPLMRLVAAARATRVRTGLSRDAGSYLCNYVYWRALEAAAKPGGPRLAVFVHVPAVAAKFRPRARRRKLTLDALARAGRAILLAVSRH